MRSKSILIIALSGIGDALMFSPALHLLRQTFPDAQIDILCMFKGVENLYQQNSDINNILRWDFLQTSLSSSFKFVLGLRGRYDISISVYPQNRWEYNIICYLVGAKQRFGHEYNHLNLISLFFLNNNRVHELDSRHNVEENIELVKLLGVKVTTEIPSLTVNLIPADEKNADEWLIKQDIQSQPLFVGFHAGSAEFKNHIKRRWAGEKYAALGIRLIKERNATVLLFGGPDERMLNERINATMNSKGYIVQTPFMTTAALMHRCKIFICNDTGLMHVAAGLQIPTVSIFAFTNPAYVYPWKTHYTMVRHPMECSPCFYYSPRPAQCKWEEDAFRCITHIELDEVWHTVEMMLS